MEQKKRVVHLMGTVIDLQIQHDSPDAVLDEAVNRLEIYERRFSANDSSSELMEINQNAGIRPVRVHPDLYELIKIGKFHSCSPDSNLNITIGPLVQTWRIGFEDAKVPEPQEIQELLKKIDPENIVLDDSEQSVFLKQTGMLIDLGALAKGYIADKIIAYLKEANVLSALINLGGNLVTMGDAPTRADHNWRIGIQNPILSRGNFVTTLKIHDQSVVTSGIYERSLKSGGETYHHILDAHTGYPIETDVVSLTIVSDQSVDGEIWTTRLFGKPVNDIIRTLETLPGIEGLVITKEGKLYFSKELEEAVEYKVKNIYD